MVMLSSAAVVCQVVMNGRCADAAKPISIKANVIQNRTVCTGKNGRDFSIALQIDGKLRNAAIPLLGGIAKAPIGTSG